VISPERGREGYDALIKDLVASGKVPNRIVHLWLLTADESYRPGSSFFHRNMERGFYSLFFLAQSLGEESVPRPIHMSVVGNGMQKVADEALRYPEKATVLGPVKVIPRELTGITCAAVDVALPKANGLFSDFPLPIHVPNRIQLFGRLGESAKLSLETVVDALEHEVLAVEDNRVVAHRSGQRFERGYDKRPQSSDGAVERRLKERGVYLITGGLGGLGLVVSDYLAKRCRARLVLINRTPMPDRGDWNGWLLKHGADDRISRKIARIRELEAAGAEVMVGAADVTDIEGMREIVEAARGRWGRIDGVLHTAGVVNDNLIQLKSLADCEDVFAPKIHGTAVLDALFEGDELDFFVLFSSTSSVIAPIGQVDYVAANAYLNAYAESRAGKGRTHTVAINWGIWNEVGMAAEALLHPEPPKTKVVEDKPIGHPLFDADGAILDRDALDPRRAPNQKRCGVDPGHRLSRARACSAGRVW
jgi:NAD(P)-dependent dehydrogenase (short-subunit alcohol dehydrogenase family)